VPRLRGGRRVRIVGRTRQIPALGRVSGQPVLESGVTIAMGSGLHARRCWSGEVLSGPGVLIVLWATRMLLFGLTRYGFL
jgi:hypothetical protein